jgi:hypothetical protein
MPREVEIEERMKPHFIAMFTVTSLVASVALGDIYVDPTGDIATGNSNLDITQVEVTDNGADLFVSMTLADLDADWGKYMIFMDAWDGGSGDNDNPWGRDIGGLGGMDMFAGAWLDGAFGGVIGHEYSNGGWDAMFFATTLSIDWATNTIHFSFSNLVVGLSSIGITGLDFEVATTGGGSGDPAIDLLGGQGGNWGEGSTGAWTYYEFSTVPAPGALALLMMAGIGRRRRS